MEPSVGMAPPAAMMMIIIIVCKSSLSLSFSPSWGVCAHVWTGACQQQLAKEIPTHSSPGGSLITDLLSIVDITYESFRLWEMLFSLSLPPFYSPTHRTPVKWSPAVSDSDTDDTDDNDCKSKHKQSQGLVTSRI